VPTAAIAERVLRWQLMPAGPRLTVHSCRRDIAAAVGGRHRQTIATAVMVVDDDDDVRRFAAAAVGLDAKTTTVAF